MRIVNWEKINGTTYKGYVLGAPKYDSNTKTYHGNIYDLNNGFSGTSDMWITMLNIDGHFNLTLHFKIGKNTYAERTEILSYENVKTVRAFLDYYEILIDWYEFKKK